MRAKTILAVGAFLCFGLSARADNTACTGAILLTPDGSVVERNFTASQDRWFYFRGKADRSYAAMAEYVGFADAADNFITFSTPVDSCGGSALTIRNRTVAEPLGWNSGVAGAGRWAIQLTADQDVFFRWTASAAATFRTRIVETTLFSPRWSTFSGFLTSWGFHATAHDEQISDDVTVTLKVFRVSGGVTTLAAEETFTVPTGQVVFKSTTGLGIPADRLGFAIATHNGLPGAIQADAFMVNPATGAGFSVKFEPRSPQK